MPPLAVSHYFAHGVLLDVSTLPVVSITHPSSRQPPPHVTVARWTGVAWETLPPTPIAWPTPVSGPRGEVYVYSGSVSDGFLTWDGSEWRALPELPNVPDKGIVTATANRATGDLLAVLCDRTSLSVVRLEGNTWRAVGNTLELEANPNPFERLCQASIAADGDSVAVAYVSGSDIGVATLGASGWRVSPVASDGGVPTDSVQIEIGPEGKLLVSWAQDASWHAAVTDDTVWRLLPDVAGAFRLFATATLRADDGAPIAYFQQGFPNLTGPFDVAVAIFKDGAWNLSQPTPAASWGDFALSRFGDGLVSAASGESISFTLLHAPR